MQSIQALEAERQRGVSRGKRLAERSDQRLAGGDAELISVIRVPITQERRGRMKPIRG